MVWVDIQYIRENMYNWPYSSGSFQLHWDNPMIVPFPVKQFRKILVKISLNQGTRQLIANLVDGVRLGLMRKGLLVI